MTRQHIAFIATALYLIAGSVVLGTFLIAPPDGLANIWIAVWTLPVTLLGLGLLHYPFDIGFPFVPSGGILGYYGSHAAYFVPVALFLAWLFYRLIRGRRS